MGGVPQRNTDSASMEAPSVICQYKYCDNPVPPERSKFCSNVCRYRQYWGLRLRPKTLVCANPECDIVFEPRSYRARCCCLPCTGRAAYLADPQKRIATQLRYYRKNKAKVRAYSREYHEKNKGKKREYNREYQKIGRESDRAVAPPKRGITIKQILRSPAEKSAELINQLIREA